MTVVCNKFYSQRFDYTMVIFRHTHYLSLRLTFAQNRCVLRVPTVANTNPPVGAGGDVVLGPAAINIIKVDVANTRPIQCSAQGNGIWEVSVWFGVCGCVCVWVCWYIVGVFTKSVFTGK